MCVCCVRAPVGAGGGFLLRLKPPPVRPWLPFFATEHSSRLLFWGWGRAGGITGSEAPAPFTHQTFLQIEALAPESQGLVSGSRVGPRPPGSRRPGWALSAHPACASSRSKQARRGPCRWPRDALRPRVAASTGQLCPGAPGGHPTPRLPSCAPWAVPAWPLAPLPSASHLASVPVSRAVAPNRPGLALQRCVHGVDSWPSVVIKGVTTNRASKDTVKRQPTDGGKALRLIHLMRD